MSEFRALNEVVHAAEAVEHEPPPAEQQRTWLPETPVMPCFGNQTQAAEGALASEPGPLDSSELTSAQRVTASDAAERATLDWARHCDPGYQDWPALVNRAQVEAPQEDVDVIRVSLGWQGGNLNSATIGRLAQGL